MQPVLVWNTFPTAGKYAAGSLLLLRNAAEIFGLRDFRQTIRNDLDNCAEIQLAVEISDVVGLHPNATIAGGAADEVFLRRTMNINASRECMRINRLETAQPNDACRDRIAARSIWCKNFASETPIVKYSADRRMIANFLCDLEETERRRHSTP